jgi:hypothetical protein
MHNAAAIETPKIELSNDNPVATTPTQHTRVASHPPFNRPRIVAILMASVSDINISQQSRDSYASIPSATFANSPTNPRSQPNLSNQPQMPYYQYKARNKRWPMER